MRNYIFKNWITYMIVNVDDFYDALKQAWIEKNGNWNRQTATATRIFNNIMRLYQYSIKNDNIDISELIEMSDYSLVQIRGMGPETVKILRRSFEILNGSETIINKTYQVTITDNDIYLLERMLEYKKKEVDLLNRIIRSAKADA